MRTRNGVRRLLRYCIQAGISCFFNVIDRSTDRYYDIASNVAPSLRSLRLRNSTLILSIKFDHHRILGVIITRAANGPKTAFVSR